MARRDDLSDDAPAADRPMSLGEHLDELRSRLLRCVIYVAVMAGAAYWFRDPLTALVLAPIHDAVDAGKVRIVSTEPAEGFFTVMKVVFFWAVFLSAPAVLLELWRFVASGLHEHEKRGVHVFAPVSYLLFIAGIVFSQLALLPVMLFFLFDVNEQTSAGVGIAIESMPRFSSIVSLVLTMALVMGLIFQLPLAMVFAQRIGVVTWRVFAGYRRHFVMGSLILAAILTPTGDPVSLSITMAPVLVLFELGILLCRVGERRRAVSKDSSTP